MTLLEYYEKGIIKDLFDKGAININFITYYRYYQVWQAYIKKGNSKNKSYVFASDECGCSVDTIRRAVRVLVKS